MNSQDGENYILKLKEAESVSEFEDILEEALLNTPEQRKQFLLSKQYSFSGKNFISIFIEKMCRFCPQELINLLFDNLYEPLTLFIQKTLIKHRNSIKELVKERITEFIDFFQELSGELQAYLLVLFHELSLDFSVDGHFEAEICPEIDSNQIISELVSNERHIEYLETWWPSSLLLGLKKLDDIFSYDDKQLILEGRAEIIEVFSQINFKEHFWHIDTPELLFSKFVKAEELLYATSDWYRDHVIHSAQIFTLGWFLFWRISEFHPQQSNDWLEYLNAWIYTSFLHDIGYPISELSTISDRIRKMLDIPIIRSLGDPEIDFEPEFEEMARKYIEDMAGNEEKVGQYRYESTFPYEFQIAILRSWKRSVMEH